MGDSNSFNTLNYDLNFDPQPDWGIEILSWLDDVFPEPPTAVRRPSVTHHHHQTTNDIKTKTIDFDVQEQSLEKKGVNENNQQGYHNTVNPFDCSICLSICKDPVVTHCGHLYCWVCLYRWLQVRDECPICKRQVTIKEVTPIYGLHKNTVEEKDKNDYKLKIPERPRAQRIQGLEETLRNINFPFPLGNMIRRFENSFDSSLINHHHDEENPPPERYNALFNRIMTSSGMRGREEPIFDVDDDILIQSLEYIPEHEENNNSWPPLMVNASRVSDVESEDSRPLRRTRFI